MRAEDDIALQVESTKKKEDKDVDEDDGGRDGRDRRKGGGGGERSSVKDRGSGAGRRMGCARYVGVVLRGATAGSATSGS